jgi:hypothetical protein
MRKFICVFFLHLFFTTAFSQSTDGINQVVEIEAKAAEHKRLTQQAETLKPRIANLEAEKQAKLQQLEAELAAMKKQRDTEISEMKMGYFCSQCNVMKSDMEKKGENFEEHLRRVNGRPIPAGDAAIAAKRQAWTEKIALKTVQINQFKERDYNGLNALKAEMEKLKARLEKICSEIYTLSQTYEQRVTGEGKKLQQGWIDPAMRAAAQEHIAQDKVFIAQGKITALEKEFREKSEELRQQIKQQAETRKEVLKGEILANNELILTLNTDLQTQTNELQTQLNPKLAQRDALNADLRMATTDSLKRSITAQLGTVTAEITQLQQRIKSMETQFNTKIRDLEAQTKKKNDEITSITLGLSKKQEDAVAALKKQYDASINNLRLQKKNFEAAVPPAHTNFLTAATEARKKLTEYVALIEKENLRMYTAAQSVKCSVKTEAQLKVSANFNTEATCMEGLRNRDRSYPATSMDCASKSNAYMSVYKSFLSTLMPEEKGYIKANTGTYWSNSVL